MPLNAAQKRFLRSKAHHLKPVVMVGQHGLNENVLNELDIALDAHELIKVRFVDDKERRRELAAEAAEAAGKGDGQGY